MSKLVHIQILRALAALSVAFLHAQNDAVGLAQRSGFAFTVPLRFPWVAGVDVFFVISGFIMVYASRDFFARPRAQSIFLARRIARIVPLYWFATTLYLAIAWLAPQFLNGSPLSLWTILASYLFIPFDHPGGPTQPIYSLGWTLNYEMFFYALFSLSLLGRKETGLSILVIGLSGLVLAGRLHAFSQPLAFWTDPIILEFAFGIIIGWLRLNHVSLDRITRICLILGGVGYLLADLNRGGPGDDLMRPLAWGLPAALLVAAVALGPEKPVSESRLTRIGIRLGDISYALYLAHPFAIRPLANLVAWNGMIDRTILWLFIGVSLLAAVGVSIVVHLWIERPATAWLRRLLEPIRSRISDS